MMAKNPSERFASLKAVADELATILKSPAAKATPSQDQADVLSGLTAGGRSTAGGRRRVPGSEIAQAEGGDRERPGVAGRIGPQMLLAPRLRAGDPDHRADSGGDGGTPGSEALLEKARGKADEIAFLICEIDEADRLNDGQTALKKAEELLRSSRAIIGRSRSRRSIPGTAKGARHGSASWSNFAGRSTTGAGFRGACWPSAWRSSA